MPMTRLNLTLLIVLVLCALSVVTSQHQSRKAFMALQSERDREARLDHEWRELQIEAQTLGTHKRIDQKAREIGMLVPDAKRSVMLMLDAPETAPAASSTNTTQAGGASK